ncbi:uncharacterized protein Asalp_26380 [Aeromonas salmonicida subsp. pectinolytica 34mel]|uniref:Uncharacterized protein n=1 Tax=Aeromonas salmonicida subsp. pectinolytica 34mel TaxID=1324960 RepID=A0A2D1QHB7_AERSA|nr:uncharacterized protein Asalp_26380 [Aeromonas salmonicida subsp. pectinolytica 34mel]
MGIPQGCRNRIEKDKSGMIIALPHPFILATGHDNDLSDDPRIAPLAAG